MKKIVICLLVAGLSVSAARATDVNARVTDMNGANRVTVAPGAEVEYKVTGVLSDQINEGLALIGFTLTFSGGDLAQADTPSQDPMKNFTRNAGIDNPAGYGGTVIDGKLVQCGGGQNTIKNFVDPENPEFPVGTVITGVAWEDTVFLTGRLTAPQEAGEYTLEIIDLFATVIREGETGIDFWRVDMAEPGNLESLIVEVSGGGEQCPQGHKFTGKFKRTDVKFSMKNFQRNTNYTALLLADDQVVATKPVTTSSKGKAKTTFKDNGCGPVYKVDVQECSAPTKVKKACNP